MTETSADSTEPALREDRRGFLATLSSIGMFGSLALAYGTLAALIGRFFYPAQRARRGWLFVRDVDAVAVGDSFVYRLPSGNPVNITRRGQSDEAGDFIALSSTCPHLGCQVHWEAQNSRYFCPCHNGIFNPEGKAISGPPADAGQSLPEYPLKVEAGLLYIEVPLDQLATGPGRIEPPGGGPPGPGHDPCLYPPNGTARRA